MKTKMSGWDNKTKEEECKWEFKENRHLPSVLGNQVYSMEDREEVVSLHQLFPSEKKKILSLSDDENKASQISVIGQPRKTDSLKMEVPSKTPVSVLQEMLSRQGLTPKYELLQEEGVIHEPTFRYRVTVADSIATGTGRSKKEAKHSAAKAILFKLQGVPEPKLSFASEPRGEECWQEGCLDNPIGLLQELCMSRRWPPPSYHTELEEGLPHERQFTIGCSVVGLKETGRGKSKKVAKRLAASRMLASLKGMPCEDNNGTGFGLDDDDELAQNLSRTTLDGEMKGKLPPTLKVSQFHRTLKSLKGPKLHALQTMDMSGRIDESLELLSDIAEEQGLTVTYVDIEEKTVSGGYQCLVQLTPIPVTVCFGSGTTRSEAQENAAQKTLQYLKHMTA